MSLSSITLNVLKISLNRLYYIWNSIGKVNGCQYLTCFLDDSIHYKAISPSQYEYVRKEDSSTRIII